MKQRFAQLILAFALIFLHSCKPESNGTFGRMAGFKPIYSKDSASFIIKTSAPKSVVHAGKIYVKGNYIFQNEIGEGIHVIDNTNPGNAQRVAFIKIAGSEELAIKGNYLYSNNYSDLVVVNITDITKATEVNRIKNAFSSFTNLRPPLPGYFECVDNSKGIVTGWIKDSIDNPKCQN